MKRTLYVLLAALLLAAPALAQVPNRLAVVQSVAAADPARFQCAHTPAACGYDFIRALACELHQSDPRWGMNGRRGDPKAPSWDALNFCGTGPGHDPTGACTSPTSVIDVIASAGSPVAAPAWIVFTKPEEATGAWIRPCGGTPTPAPTPPSAPVVPPYPGDPIGNLIGLALFADYAEKGEPPNSGMVIWAWRCAWDMAVNRLEPDAAIAKHRKVWREALGLPPLP